MYVHMCAVVWYERNGGGPSAVVDVSRKGSSVEGGSRVLQLLMVGVCWW